MAAVSAQAYTTQRERVTQTPIRKSTRKACPRKRGKSSQMIVVLTCLIVLVGAVFGFVAMHANLAETGYNRAQLLDAYRAETLKGQRLQIRYSALTAPDRVVAAAGKAGMVYAKNFDYCRPSRVASAKD